MDVESVSLWSLPYAWKCHFYLVITHHSVGKNTLKKYQLLENVKISTATPLSTDLTRVVVDKDEIRGHSNLSIRNGSEWHQRCHQQNPTQQMFRKRNKKQKRKKDVHVIVEFECEVRGFNMLKLWKTLFRDIGMCQRPWDIYKWW